MIARLSSNRLSQPICASRVVTLQAVAAVLALRGGAADELVHSSGTATLFELLLSAWIGGGARRIRSGSGRRRAGGDLRLLERAPGCRPVPPPGPYGDSSKGGGISSSETTLTRWAWC
jgi:hypothetical protein